MIDNKKDVFIFYLNEKEIERRIGFEEAHERFKALVFSGKVKNNRLIVVRDSKLFRRVEWVY